MLRSPYVIASRLSSVTLCNVHRPRELNLSAILLHRLIAKGVFIATQLNSTQLNSTDPVEQRTAKSVVFLFMTSRPTN